MAEYNGQSAKGRTSGRMFDERHAWIWIMLFVNIVLFLLLMLLGFIALKVGNYLPNDTDVIVIVGKSDVEVSDGDGKWESGKNINIFKTNHENGSGETTVISQDGTKVVAPGTCTTYKFTMFNNANFAVAYETDLDFTLKIGDEAQSDYTFPLKVRLSTEDGFYLIGGENDWEKVNSATLTKHVSLLGKSSYETFILELLWEFDGGSDELDTMYGDMVAERGITLTLGINTYAEEHYNPEATGGTQVEIEGEKSDDGALTLLWLLFLILTSAIIIFYVSWLMTIQLNAKKKNETDTNGSGAEDGLDSR